MTRPAYRTAPSLALAATFALATGAALPAGAQTAETPTTAPAVAEAPAGGGGVNLPMGEEVGDDAMGDTYVAETFGDWTMMCQRTEDGSDPCGLTQLINDPEGSPMAEITVFPVPPGGEAAAGVNVVTPLGTVVAKQLSLRVDGGTARRYPFFFCDVGGCYAQFGLTPALLESFRRGNAATLTIFAVMAPDQPIDMKVSLIGFTAGFNALPIPSAP